MMKERRR